MSSVMRFDEWQDSDGNPVLDGTGLSIPTSALPTGSILQVVSNTFSTETTTGSSTFQPTGLTATITPSLASSKVLILATNALRHDTNGIDARATIFRGTTAGTNLGVADYGFGRMYNGVGGLMVIAHISFLDSPSTASAQLYTMAFAGGGSGTVRAQNNDALATMTLIEVAG